MKNYFSIYGLYRWRGSISCSVNFKINKIGEIIYEFTIWTIWWTVCT
ncbi:hypothetical protein SAMN05443428_14213 [Caloramator quimbayensis]|uniref:Uncharacterized protein n=1 Tax=Caloramator quimbayensis TaxID=1147123 RepID=A0A1T4YEP3_9CLOT|nr:hypothetical protein SAMN05443428_14213 [Caloramator quimbayensis]